MLKSRWQPSKTCKPMFRQHGHISVHDMRSKETFWKYQRLPTMLKRRLDANCFRSTQQILEPFDIIIMIVNAHPRVGQVETQSPFCDHYVPAGRVVQVIHICPWKQATMRVQPKTVGTGFCDCGGLFVHDVHIGFAEIHDIPISLTSE